MQVFTLVSTPCCAAVTTWLLLQAFEGVLDEFSALPVKSLVV